MTTRYSVEIASGYLDSNGEPNYKYVNTAESLSDLAGLMEYVRGYPVIKCRLTERDETGLMVRSALLGTRIGTSEDEDEDEEVALYRCEAREAALSEAHQLVHGLEMLGDDIHRAAITAVADKLREYLEGLR